MELLAKLYQKALKEQSRFMIRFDPNEPIEAMWSIRYYPDPQENGNFWSEGDTFESTFRKLLDEIEGFE